MKLTNRQKDAIRKATNWFKEHRDYVPEAIEYATRLDEETINFIKERQSTERNHIS